MPGADMCWFDLHIFSLWFGVLQFAESLFWNGCLPFATCTHIHMVVKRQGHRKSLLE